MNLLRREDGLYIRQGLDVTATGLVVNHANTLQRSVFVDEVETVDAPTNLYGGSKRPVNITFETENGKGCQAAVYLKELAQVVNNHLAVDDVKTAQRTVGKFVVKGFVNGTLYLDLGFQ